MPCWSPVHRDGGLKANHSLTFSMTIWKKVTFTEKVTFGACIFDEPQPRPFFYKYTYKNKGLIALSRIWTAWVLGENDAFLT